MKRTSVDVTKGFGVLGRSAVTLRDVPGMGASVPPRPSPQLAAPVRHGDPFDANPATPGESVQYGAIVPQSTAPRGSWPSGSPPPRQNPPPGAASATSQRPSRRSSPSPE